MAQASSDPGLDAWLTPFLAAMRHKKRRCWAPLYLRGLLGPGDRKSLQPMASRLGLSGHDQLQHFVASPAWDDGPLWTELARTADRLVGGEDACLVIDDTAVPKRGTLSVGVARQYCGALGKKANCQSLVSLTLAHGEVPVPVALRLFLPDEWVSKPARCRGAGVPDAVSLTPRTKGEIALSELDRLRAARVRFGTVLADAGYGTSAAFRRGLDARGLRWAVGIAKNQKVYDAHVQVITPTGRARRPVPDQEPREAEAVLAALPWRRVTWRRGTKGTLSARFAVTRVRVGDGAVWANNRHLPGAEVWLVGKWRASGERKVYLSNLPPQTTRRALIGTIKARWGGGSGWIRRPPVPRPACSPCSRSSPCWPRASERVNGGASQPLRGTPNRARPAPMRWPPSVARSGASGLRRHHRAGAPNKTTLPPATALGLRPLPRRIICQSRGH